MRRLLLTILVAVLFLTPYAFAQVSQIDSGGATMAGDSHRMSATLGQSIQGSSSGEHRLLTRSFRLPISSILPGDIDASGDVSFLDALEVLRFVLRFREPTDIEAFAADVNRDGRITIADAIAILQIEAGSGPLTKPISHNAEPAIQADWTNGERLRLRFGARVRGGDVVLRGLNAAHARIEPHHGQVASAQNAGGDLRFGFAGSNSGQNIVVDVVLIHAEAPAHLVAEGVLFDGAGVSIGHVSVGVRASTPSDYALFQNVPNPFNPVTLIRFGLLRSSRVELMVYDITGQLVRVLLTEEMDAGLKEVVWDGRDAYGRQAATGIYFYRIQAGQYQATRRMVLLK